MSEVREPAGGQPDIRATAVRLRVSIGAFKRRSHEAWTEGELTGPQLTVLSRIDRLGPVTTAELARRDGEDHGQWRLERQMGWRSLLTQSVSV